MAASAPTVVIGGGVAGLATAWRLAQTDPPPPIVVLEQTAVAGGLAGTVTFDGMRLDLGSHRIHPEYFPEALALLRHLLGDALLRVPRHGRLRLNGGYVDYPPSLLDFLGALGPREIARCAVGLIGARLRAQPVARGAALSYQDHLLPLVGRRAYDLFYAPYARKVFGIDPSQVSVAAAKTRITTARPWAMARQLVRRWRVPETADRRFFYYPAGGFGSIGEALLAAATARGVALRTGADVRALRTAGGRVREVAYAQGGGDHAMAPAAVVSSLPLHRLVEIVEPAAPADVRAAAAGLRWRGIRLLQVQLAGARCLDGETYYFPEERYCFGRISEPPQFSPRMRDDGARTALNIEVICSPGDALWSLDEPAFLARVLRDIVTIGLFRPGDVLASRSLRLPAVYPVYDLAYRERLARVLGWVESFDNLYSIGRGGLFLHANTDHSIHLGLRLGEHLARPGARAATWRRDLPDEEFRVRD